MPDIHQPPRQPAHTEGKQQNTKTLRPEKQNYTGHEQPPKAASADTGFGCLLTLQGRRRHCLLGASFTRQRLDMSQAEFIKRWCLNNVLAEVSSDADGSAVARVHVPPLAAVTVPVALQSSSVLSGPFLACSACCLWLRRPWAAVQGLCSFAFRALVSSCSAVCSLCWLPRRLVYDRHVRTLD
jgi:hypothetical protein